jgi:hypothetical protein
MFMNSFHVSVDERQNPNSGIQTRKATGYHDGRLQQRITRVQQSAICM